MQLARPTGHFCRVHASEAYSVTEEVAAELWEVFLKDADLSVSQGGKTVYLQVGSPLFGSTDEPFYHVVPLRPDLGKILLRAAKPAARGRLSKSAIHTFAKQIREYVMDEFVKHAAVSLGEAHGAARSGSIVATTSRFENIALRIADKKKVQQVDVEDWEKLRTLRLPWISHLDANEILELREVASKALDPFRLTMRKQLISEKPVQDEDDVAKKVVMELQEAVSIVDSGLRACQSKAKKGFSVLLGSLGLSFVIYGVGSSNFGAASAGAAMMAALTLQHGRDCDAKAEEEKLVSNPGNVLVVARELISHRKHD